MNKVIVKCVVKECFYPSKLVPISIGGIVYMVYFYETSNLH